MSIEKEFVPYQEALALKELGFDEKCLCNWEESWSPEPEHEIRMVLTTDQTWLRPGWICAPTFSQAFRWFREKYGDFLRYDCGVVPHFLMIQIEMTKGKTYEEAELTCLRKLIEIVQGGNK